MATIDLYEPYDDSQLRELLKRAYSDQDKAQQDDMRLAVDYLEGRQRNDVDARLRERYPGTQGHGQSSSIVAQTIPLTQRYVAEAANAYNRSVERTLTLPDGSTNVATESVTDELRVMLGDCQYDETMARLEQVLVLARVCCVWYQARAGKLRPIVTFPFNVFPVEPLERDWFMPANQADYAGFAVCTRLGANEKERSEYAFVAPAQTSFYGGMSAFEISGEIQTYPNPYAWPQVVDTDDSKGLLKTLPLQMLQYWHRELPLETLVPDSDMEIVMANRELNIQLSILLDTLSHQSWAIPILNVADPATPPHAMSVGPRKALVLGPGESASMLTSGVDYAGLITTLQQWVRMLAMATRQSPSDFSIEAQGAVSGFSKLVDSLPKLEARQDRIKRLMASEAASWPRLAAIGSALGLLSGSAEQLAKLRLKTTFADLDLPLSTQEQVMRDAFDLEHGITTPTKILARRKGISLEQAEEEMGEAEAPEAEQGQPQGDESDNAGQAAAVTEDIQKTVLNGAQVSSLVEVVKATAMRELPRDSAIKIIELAFQLGAAEAEALVGSAGDSFAPASAQSAPQQPGATPMPMEPMTGQRKPPERSGVLGRLIGARGPQPNA